jgi:hypothetical protein
LTDVENGLTDLEKILVTPIDALTTVDLKGSGAFDVLMRATKMHLLEEYDASRITGVEYSTVYLGALVQVLQTATQFLMNEQQVHKINAEIGLIRQQTVTELALTDDNLPHGLGYNHIEEIATAVPAVPVISLPPTSL